MKRRGRDDLRANQLAADLGIDIIGDVHACWDEFIQLIGQLGYQQDQTDGLYRHPAGRKLLSIGDITSRGPKSIPMLKFFIKHVKAGLAEMTDSNHGWKIARWLDGRQVSLKHGDEKVSAEFADFERQFGAEALRQLQEQSRWLLITAPSHILLTVDGEVRAVAVHAGIRDEYIGQSSPAVQNFCRYGDVAGMAADGRPIRRDWTEAKQSPLTIVWGHDPRPEPERKRGAINIDQGCVFGGMLTAYRFPEDELVSVPAKENYSGEIETPLTRYAKKKRASSAPDHT
ncbi:biotin transporter BioY [Brevibacillus humidisoli]|uniref:biotin transporter BioY n=1 Tax=Brevibacillus humidisoli TaxID=2895522 RepID=UPI001E594C25|nr:biotin transporter BioY [Brevibacillus humidisoli]UFJ41260.1 biotin transporter BioY [Brevibacillus humidisoli]